MSLYRKWRPTVFDDLVGQTTVVRTLTSALQKGRLAHAYLFSGPRGSGKTSAAKIFARAITCETGPAANPCNTCGFCRSVIAGNAFDVIEIDAASNNGVEQIRDIRDAIKYPPNHMRARVYIIDEAHMITSAGWNAFLKTLEEPPPYAYFLLATTEPNKIMATVRSRCQRYDFRKIAVPVMIERMRTIANAEQIDIDEAALSAIAYRADGSLRDALTLLEQAIAFSEGPISNNTLESAFGISDQAEADRFIDAFLSRDVRGALHVINDVCAVGNDLNDFIRASLARVRNLAVINIDATILAEEFAANDLAELAQNAKKYEPATIAYAMRALRVLTEPNVPHGRIEIEAAVLHLVPTPALSTAPLPIIARPAQPPVRAALEPKTVITPAKRIVVVETVPAPIASKPVPKQHAVIAEQTKTIPPVAVIKPTSLPEPSLFA